MALSSMLTTSLTLITIMTPLLIKALTRILAIIVVMALKREMLL
jgi:hypothetical protein